MKPLTLKLLYITHMLHILSRQKNCTLTFRDKLQHSCMAIKAGVVSKHGRGVLEAMQKEASELVTSFEGFRDVDGNNYILAFLECNVEYSQKMWIIPQRSIRQSCRDEVTSDYATTLDEIVKFHNHIDASLGLTYHGISNSNVKFPKVKKQRSVKKRKLSKRELEILKETERKREVKTLLKGMFNEAKNRRAESHEA